MMQRWELPAFGRDNLVLTPALRPKPDPKEVLVKVEAVSLNYRDLVESMARLRRSIPTRRE